jgi:D-alanyl-lipoteichoic acid acyltransferase DltB (MBOAT superfamily)
VDYACGLRIRTNKRPKNYLIFSLLFNLGVLAVFKYFDFFADGFVRMTEMVGFKTNPLTLHLILPVGISFYTFQTLSYTIDVYRKRMEPTNNLLAFAGFVAFFPQLVAGPIERASHLLPQFLKPTKTVRDYERHWRLILLGFFKKIVIADQLAPFVETVFSSPGSYGGLDILSGILFFGFQIYGDFSGYSDIAIGLAGLLGFDLMTNFKTPYLAKSVPDFWHRWHISLSTWFRDYVFIPLGGNRVTTPRYVLNIFIVFMVSGLWHGAHGHFILWGFYHAVIYWVFGKSLGNKGWFSMVVTFVLVQFGWVFFRTTDWDNLQHLFSGLTHIDSYQLGWKPWFWVFVMMSLDLFHRNDVRNVLWFSKNVYVRYAGLSIILLIVLKHFGASQDFIYFQF